MIFFFNFEVVINQKENKNVIFVANLFTKYQHQQLEKLMLVTDKFLFLIDV